jgi:hypothetical protein
MLLQFQSAFIGNPGVQGVPLLDTARGSVPVATYAWTSPWLSANLAESASRPSLKDTPIAVFLLLAKFHQISTYKIWFQSMQRISHGKNGPNSPDFEFLFYIFFKSPDFYDKFQ